MNRELKVVISGSFRKHLPEIGFALKQFQKASIQVLAPLNHEAINSGEDFIVLKIDDPQKSADILEREFMENIRKADFLYLTNIGGYIGRSAATEMGIALLQGIPIIAAENIKIISDEISKPAQIILYKSIFAILSIKDIKRENIQNLNIQGYVPRPLTPPEVSILQKEVDSLLQSLKSAKIPSMSNLNLKPSPTLSDFQAYVAEMVKERGFDKETISEIFMLFLEECGELAKAARKTQNIHTDRNSEVFKLEQEAADVFIYLLDICNHFNIDLEKAFRDKEEINKKRSWE